jgi:formamidopyrimidine-DNA glycosylase
MPELPEVETHTRNLARWATGRKILDVSPPPGTRETMGIGSRAFVSRLRGRKIERVWRRGKWILLDLSGGAGLGLHLGMTGHIMRVPNRDALPRFARAVFALDGGARMVFQDSRRFGRLVPVPDRAELASMPEIAALGPDALGMTPAQLAEALASTTRTVKEAIMDQRVIAGVGNLYATEALWRAKIHPARPARTADAKKLLTAIRAALQHGLRTYSGQQEPEYIEEGGPNPFYCYDRAGEPCRRCKTKIRAMTLGGRTSAYCPHCQK